MSVPKLRFPEFRESEEWLEKKLEDIASFHKGKGISKADIDPNGATSCIRYGELYTCYNEIISTVYSKTNAQKNDLFLSKKNDVIIPSSGETHIDIATASCVMFDDIALGGDLNVIRGKQNGIFISYYLSGPKKKEIAKIAQGNTVIHLYASQLKSLLVSLPSLPEQQKIASCLSSLDDLIRFEDSKLDELKKHKQGLMQQIFPQDGEIMPNLRFEEFNGDWEEKIGGDVFKSISNKNHKSDLPILAITQEYGAIPRELIDYNVSVTDKSIASYKVVDVGDFIISLRSFQGGIEYSTYKGICSPAYIVLKPKIKIHKYFFKFYFKTFAYIRLLNRNLEGIRDGKMISYSYFSEINLPLPSIEEQEKIAACLSSLDDLIIAQTAYIATLKQQKKGLMQQLFPVANEAVT